MFTGIVEEVGTVVRHRAGRIAIQCEVVLDGTEVGDSIAVDGCCLTVVSIERSRGERNGVWEADLSPETLRRTKLGDLVEGSAVNLERALRADGRIGGHFVQGHVDGVGVVCAPAPELEVRIPSELVRYVVPKGSIAIDGVSLTVAASEGESVRVAVIPHTATVTTLGRLRVGDRVNVEVDLLAKYVESLLGRR
ncbi:MAG: riboflavin synthase subunit alpha [Acidimicrobiales bacterium]|nr:MAG: riboflavin synthase subunit alpha [Acidimicrobiales bacterium]